MYTEAGCVPWQRVQNSFVDVCYLSGLPKETPKFFLNASKLFKRGDWNFEKGVNHVKDVPDNKVLMAPII